MDSDYLFAKRELTGGNQSAFLMNSLVLIKAIESLILMKDFAILPLQALNCRQEKLVDRDWTVLVTTKRVARRRTYALELSGRTSEPEFETEEIRSNGRKKRDYYGPLKKFALIWWI